jgi:hypothetical protein
MTKKTNKLSDIWKAPISKKNAEKSEKAIFVELYLWAADAGHGLGLLDRHAGRLQGLLLLLAVVVHDHAVLAGLFAYIVQAFLEAARLVGDAFQLRGVVVAQRVTVLLQGSQLAVQRLQNRGEFEPVLWIRIRIFWASWIRIRIHYLEVWIRILLS